MTLDRRGFLAGLGVLGAGLSLSRWGQATTLVALDLDQLVASSARVVETLPVAHRSEWLTLGGRRRIVTWTRLVHSELWHAAPGESSEDECEVMTLGGSIGERGEKVFGEAHLQQGVPCLLFLGSATNGAAVGTERRVVGMAQGEFLFEGTGSARQLRKSPGLPELVRKKGSGPAACDRLHHLGRDQARDLVTRAAPGHRR